MGTPLSFPPNSEYCGDASWVCPDALYDPITNPYGLRQAPAYVCQLFYNPCTSCLADRTSPLPVLYILDGQQDVPCDVCSIPPIVSSSAAASAYASASSSASATAGDDAFSTANAQASAGTAGVRLLRRLQDSQQVPADLTQLPGLLTAYSYDPTNQSTVVLYNVSTPVTPPSLNNSGSVGGVQGEDGDEEDDDGDQSIFFYGNSSAGLNTTMVDNDSCPEWCLNVLNATQRTQVPDCTACPAQ